MKTKLLFVLLSFTVALQSMAYKQSTGYVNVNNKSRNMIIFKPDNLPDNSPLMIVTHGMNQDPEYQMGDKMYELIDTAKFVVVYPRSDGSTWDTGGSNDMNFIIKIIDKMYEENKIDKNRVYWSGFSMGSMLIYHCMPQMQDRIAAFAPTSGIQFSEQPWNNCKKPVNLIHCHAYGDDVFGYEQYGIRNYVMHFKDLDKTTTYKKTTKYYPNGPTWWDGDKEVWSGGENGSEVELFSYNNGGHWPMAGNHNEIWNFCKRFSLDPNANNNNTPTPKIVAGGKKDVHLSAVEFKSWNNPSANASSNGTLANNYGGGGSVEGGTLLFGDNEVSNLKYADLTGCTKLTFLGNNGIQVRALFNRQTATGSDYVEKSGTITDGKFEINLSEVSTSYVHLNAIKTNWGSPSGTISNIYVNDPKSPIDYCISGKGSLDESAVNALSDPTAKNINAFGLTNEEPVTLNTVNKNCLIYVNSNNKVSNTSNVVMKNGNSYTANNIVLADGGFSFSETAEAGFPWVSVSGDGATWTEGSNGSYTYSWTANNCSAEIFHNILGKTQFNYVVAVTSEFTAPWGVRFLDESGATITEQGYWNGQNASNMIKEINIDSLFAKNGVSDKRQSLKAISVYNINDNGRVTFKEMYLRSGGNDVAYPFYAPYNITATNAKCYVTVNTFAPTWVPFEANIPTGYNAYEISETNNIKKVNKLYPNKPLLLEGNGIAEITAANTTINATQDLTNGNLVGVNEKTQPEAGSYAFINIKGTQGVAFNEVKTDDNSYVYPLHAYISKATSSNVLKAIGNLIAGEDPNAINNESIEAAGIECIYNITGAKINQIQQGVNLIKMTDGSVKKVLVK
ncbi:MAG: hypothetical protein IKO36_12085 [Bacteroidaceae bacterium]|nr:hypothetical protein [Bacteroidaceae bacterium]